MEEYRTGTGQLVVVHSRYACITPLACVVHSPSDHNMRGWKTHWRQDRLIMERLCPKHGVGHPDPDDYEFGYLKYNEDEALARGIHGCCGCCRNYNQVEEKSEK